MMGSTGSKPGLMMHAVWGGGAGGPAGGPRGLRLRAARGALPRVPAGKAMCSCSMAASPSVSSESNTVGATDASVVAADASDTRFDNTLKLRVAIGSSTGLGNEFSGDMCGMFSQAGPHLDLNTRQAAKKTRFQAPALPGKWLSDASKFHVP